MGFLTNCSNDLRFQTELGLETTDEIGESAPAVTSNIRHLADVVEHVPADKKQN